MRIESHSILILYLSNFVYFKLIFKSIDNECVSIAFF